MVTGFILSFVQTLSSLPPITESYSSSSFLLFLPSSCFVMLGMFLFAPINIVFFLLSSLFLDLFKF